MKPGLLRVFSDDTPASTIIGWLNNSSFDELIEYEPAQDRCSNLYHVAGKYHVPTFEGSYQEIYRYALEYMVHPDDCELYAQVMEPSTLLQRLNSPENAGCLYARFRYKLQNGKWRWVEKYIFDGTAYGFGEGLVRSYVFDIQNQVDRQAGIANDTFFQAEPSRDEKTRLFGEKAFYRMAENLMANDPDADWCIIAIDIFHFRLFNDWYGRDAGDLLLAKTGEALTDVERETGALAAYFGQDDFCMLARYNQQMLTHLYARLNKSFLNLKTFIGFKPIMGVSLIDGSLPLLDVVDHAKIALEYARGDFKKNICLFESGMLERTNREYQILLEFNNGIKNKEFVAYLQPQCRISTGKIIGAEALARWRKADGQLVSPADFIPVLEKYGFITDLDCYIWEEVCRHLRNWIDQGHEAIPISVNVSQSDFYAIDVAAYLDGLMKKYDLPKQLLKVEITESSFAENADSVIETTQRLRDAGFMVLMDDFGSGYSSLNMLSSLNVDVIKLDAAFLRMSEEEKAKGVHILESIINMAKTMTLPIITEGVETQEQAQFLESMGCRFIQGFYYYRPMPVDDFKDLILSGQEIDRGGFVCKSNEQMQVREFLDQNIYSDSMLNNILGAVAFVSWHGGSVDVVRFNEQLYEEVGIPDLESHLTDIQNLVPADERRTLYDLLEQAQKDYLNGASGTIGMVKSDGAIAKFKLHLYHLSQSTTGELFYASFKDVTDSIEFEIQKRILAEHFQGSIMFARRIGEQWHLKVIVHGLGNVIGVPLKEMQVEFDSGTFLKRMKPGAFEAGSALAHEALLNKEGFEYEYEFLNAEGTYLTLVLKAHYIAGEPDGITHILIIREKGNPNLL